MKERPILFSGPMVRAILEGRKTQTRRVMKFQPPAEKYELATLMSSTGKRSEIGKKNWILRDGLNVLDDSQPLFQFPFGTVGDHLWVRETWAAGQWLNRSRPRDLANTEKIYYRASYSNESHFVWRPSIFLPRWASRITLEITKIGVERLNDISELDAMAEGTSPRSEHGTMRLIDGSEQTGEWLMQSHYEAFQELWDSINGEDKAKNWAANPFVWVIEFKKI